MASTTWLTSALEPPFIFCTSSGKPARPALRASGRRRLSIRYCLSVDRSRPEWSFSNLRRYSYSGGVTGASQNKREESDGLMKRSLDQADFLELGCDDVLVERVHDVLVGAGGERTRDVVDVVLGGAEHDPGSIAAGHAPEIAEKREAIHDRH